MFEFTYRCVECAREYPISRDLMLCPDCAGRQKDHEPLRGVLEVVIKGRFAFWRDLRGDDWPIHELLPVKKEFFPAIPVGNTPLWEPSHLRIQLGFPQLYIKDEGANPTGSLKDRASYLVAAFAKREGVRKIAVASTGNAGSSMAGVGAAAGIPVQLFLPEAAPEAKITQALQYGANVVRVQGSYDDAFDMAADWARKQNCLCRNTAYHPMTTEGKKTAALEIFKQLGNRMPDYVFVSAGDGVILSGLYRGFEDLKLVGLCEAMPHIIAVQSEGSQAIKKAFDSGSFDPEYHAGTVADSLMVDVPRGGYFALKKLKKYGGSVITVTDDAILKAQKRLSSSTGLFTEPAGAAAAAGFFDIKHSIPETSVVVIMATGTGLKDIVSAKKGLTP